MLIFTITFKFLLMYEQVIYLQEENDGMKQIIGKNSLLTSTKSLAIIDPEIAQHIDNSELSMSERLALIQGQGQASDNPSSDQILNANNLINDLSGDLNNAQKLVANCHQNQASASQKVGTSSSEHIFDPILDMMYVHPDDQNIRGRPFDGLVKYGHILERYLQSQELEIHIKQKSRLLKPQLVTGLSSNHFNEHKAAIESVWEKFPGQNVMVFDLGLSQDEINFFLADRRYIYNKLEFSNYPKHVKWLTSMAFKVLCIMECLIQYGNCLWFDTSIVFHENASKLIMKHIIKQKSSFVYYIKPAGHNVAWATHPIMFAYLPSNISHFNQENVQMSQGGASMTVNTFELKHKIMKFAIACALTHECIAPNYEITAKRVRWGTYNPWGNFEHRYCNSSYPKNHPFVCHRFDQSMWMILVANCYNFDERKYRPVRGDEIGFPNRAIGKDLPQVSSQSSGSSNGRKKRSKKGSKINIG